MQCSQDAVSHQSPNYCVSQSGSHSDSLSFSIPRGGSQADVVYLSIRRELVQIRFEQRSRRFPTRAFGVAVGQREPASDPFVRSAAFSPVFDE